MFKELILMTTVTNFFKKRIVHLCKNEEWFKNDFDFYYLAKGTVNVVPLIRPLNSVL